MLKEAKNIFIVGIKGSGLVNLAVLLKKMGKNVTGSDVAEVFITDEVLIENNISIITSFEPTDLPANIDVLIYTGAHKGSNNPQVVEAVKRGVATMSMAQAHGEVIKLFHNSVAVCGTHGKTTTASLLAFALKQIGAKPSYLIGTPTFSGYFGGEYEDNNYFVIEADEYAVNPPLDKTAKFLLMDPRFILCNNIDLDHPDIYSSLEEVEQTFKTFFTKRSVQSLFVCADDSHLMETVRTMSNVKYLSFGFATEADLQIMNLKTFEDHSEFELVWKKQNIGSFSIKLFGNKNISNVAGVILCLLQFNFSIESIRESIRDFEGAKRRFEKVEYINDLYLFDDYAHNPQKVAAAIDGARKRFPQRRVIVIFQPHTYSRTHTLKQEFVEALSHADVSLIAPIFASAREKKEDFPVTSQDLEAVAQKHGKENVRAFASTNDILGELPTILKKGDVVFTMGAGDIYKMKDGIIDVLKNIKN